jgi:hypothetical protein
LGGQVEIYRSRTPNVVLWTQWDLYAAADGAHTALVANDFPDQWLPASGQLSLGDDGDAATYAGEWGDLGTLIVRWRRGNVVFTAEVQAPLGVAQVSTVEQFAQQIDSAWNALHAGVQP